MEFDHFFSYCKKCETIGKVVRCISTENKQIKILRLAQINLIAMFRGFQLEPGTLPISTHRARGQQISSRFQSMIKPALGKYILATGSLDGSKMQEDGFPQVKADIFLSHAHGDSELAIGLAGWLYDKFSITTFIDSGIWGHADELLRQLADKYGKEDNKLIIITIGPSVPHRMCT